MHKSDEVMICIGNFKKFVYFQSKGKNSVTFAFTDVLESPGLFYADFCLNLYSIDSDEEF
jgi:hypothetical protein